MVFPEKYIEKTPKRTSMAQPAQREGLSLMWKRELAEAQSSLSDEDLEKGIESYFIQRTRTVEKDGKEEAETDMIAIPLT